VVLENVRGFKGLDFTLARPEGKYQGWTVVTGDNASGKTTLLKAIAAVLVGPDSVRALQPSWKGWVRQGAKEAVIAVEIQGSNRDRFVKGRPFEQPFWAELRLSENGGPEVSLSPGRKYVRKEKGPTNGPWAENPIGWFCVGYGPFRRLYGASSEAQRIMSGPSRIARFATMFREDATLGECELWLKELHHRSLEERSKEKTLLEHVKRVLDYDFLRNGLSVAKVDSEGLWLRHRNGPVLPLAEMSEGYRAAIAMLIDILRHLANVYGESDLVQERAGRPCVELPGVVLIDEVDSHLHPQWQRQLGFWLKDFLPNIQFITTTHSPIICQAADRNGLFHLPAPSSDVEPFAVSEEDRLTIVRGTLDPVYLSPAFNLPHTRSPVAVAKREEHARLQSKKATVGLTEMEKGQLKFAADWLEDDSTAEEL
jgi:energy-coupling factor transporter ATP-binding protein EcfA2